MKPLAIFNPSGHVFDDARGVENNVVADPVGETLYKGIWEAGGYHSEGLTDGLAGISANIDARSVCLKCLPQGCPPATWVVDVTNVTIHRPLMQ